MARDLKRCGHIFEFLYCIFNHQNFFNVKNSKTLRNSQSSINHIEILKMR